MYIRLNVCMNLHAYISTNTRAHTYAHTHVTHSHTYTHSRKNVHKCTPQFKLVHTTFWRHVSINRCVLHVDIQYTHLYCPLTCKVFDVRHTESPHQYHASATCFSRQSEVARKTEAVLYANTKICILRCHHQVHVLILTWIQKVQETAKTLALLAAGPSSATAKMVYGPTSECILKNVMPTWWYCIAWLFDQMMIKLWFWIDLWALRTITSSNCCTQTAWFKLLKLAQCEHYLYSEI